MAAVLLAVLALQLPRLQAPPLGRDSWRECDTLMVARNFCTERTSLWEPHADERAGGDGATGMEFPLLNALVGTAFCRGLPLELTARALTLSFTLLATALLWLLASAEHSPRAAGLAALVFASAPTVFYFGRSAQPDVPAMALALGGVTLVERATRGARLRPALLLGAACCFALAGLVKVPALVFGLPAAALAWRRLGAGVLRAKSLWVGLVLALGPPLLWLRHALQLVERSGIDPWHLRRPPGELLQAWLSPDFWVRIFGQQLFDAYAFPLASALAVLALVLLRARLGVLPLSMAGAALAFFLLTGESGAHHLYYGVMAAPALALLSAVGVDTWLQKRSARVGGLVVAALAVGCTGYALQRTWGWFAPGSAREPFAQVRAALDAQAPSSEPVLLVSKADPTALYPLERKGTLAPVDGVERFLREAPALPRLVVLDGKPYGAPERAALGAALAQRGYRQLADTPRLEAWGAMGTTPN